MEETRLQTFVLLVDNEPGILSQIARLFNRKGYNIENMSAGPTNSVDTTRITIQINTDNEHAELLSNQLRKIFPVHSVKIINPENSVQRELAFFKVKASNSEKRNEIIQIANIFRANIVDVSVEALTLAVIGEGNKTHAFEKILNEYEVIEIVRTGVIAIERGYQTIYDQTKEKGELNKKKNVL